MKIEFIFNGIKDIEKLYEIKSVESPFGGNETCLQHDYLGKEYCDDVVSQAVAKFPEISDSSYHGCVERKANEQFIIQTSGRLYTLIFTIDTYNYEKARMVVHITSAVRNEAEANDSVESEIQKWEYDLFLEQFKIELKNILKNDWNSCAWITDEQSELLCTWLYPRFFKLENSIRAFSNKVLIHQFGIGWLKQTGLEKYFNSHKSLSIDFKRQVPCFADIDDTFIAMTMETMFEVIQKAKVYEENIELSDEDYNLIHQKVAENGASSLIELIRKKRKIKVDFWEDVFKQYFQPEDQTSKAITNFIKNRNHVAHNKLINWSSYQVMFQNIDDLDNTIRQANTQFEESVPSEELYMTWDAEEEAAREAEAEVEWEKNYLRDRIKGETGVEVKFLDGIFELFCDEFEEFYTSIEDSYYFSPYVSVSQMSGLEMRETRQEMFTITSNADEKSVIELLVEMSLDDEMDGDSELLIICRKSGDSTEEICRATLRYHNGSGYEDMFDGVIMLESESEYDHSGLSDFVEQLQNYVENDLNPFIKKLKDFEYEAARYGACEPVTEFPCIECEENGVSVMEVFYPIGHCCFCGTDNEVSTCKKCGDVFEDGTGENGLCDACIPQKEL